MKRSDEALLNEGMERLTDALGIVEAERFISLLMRERFDYTEWQKEAFADMSLEDIERAAQKYAKERPHGEKSAVEVSVRPRKRTRKLYRSRTDTDSNQSE